MGQGRLFRVVGWDGQTGTHLLLSVPGVEEDIPWEQYLQVKGGAWISVCWFDLIRAEQAVLVSPERRFQAASMPCWPAHAAFDRV